MVAKTLEELLADPEREARIEARLAKIRASRPENWVELVAGCMTGIEGFDEAVRLGREWREQQNWIEDEDEQ